MKRAAALVPLSREHHEALVLARRACEPQRPGAGPAMVRMQVLRRWPEHFEPHFAEDERSLLPALRAAGAGAEVAEALRQHAALRALARRLGTDPDALPDWGEAMRDHVHWEERLLFPLAERLLRLHDAVAADLACS